MLTLKQRLRKCILIEGARVYDLTDNRETHIVSYHPDKNPLIIDGTAHYMDKVRVWFDSSIHKTTGNGTSRTLNKIILL
jgi:hypothetical protein